MKKKLRAVLCSLCTVVFFTGCNFYKIQATILTEPAKTTPLSYSEAHSDEELNIFREKAEGFAAKFADEVYAKQTGKDNYVVSPVSVFMGLSLAAECSAGETKNQILSALDLSTSELQGQISKLYRQLNKTHERMDYGLFGEKSKKTGEIKLSNSIWISEAARAKSSALDVLSKKYFCHAYAVDFLKENDQANRDIESFLRRETNDLIDVSLDLDDTTVFALINTLYLKDVWNSLGKDIDRTDKKYIFTETGGETEAQSFLQGKYIQGKPYEGKTFMSFHVSTLNSYRIQFILPKDGYTADEIFTAENIVEAKNCDYTWRDDENKIKYYTRSLFPEFSAAFDGKVETVLQECFGIADLFHAKLCDMSTLSDEPLYCTEVRHITKLKVDRKGIEGAAVTITPGAGAPGPDEYEEVYLDFVVDRGFGFVLTDTHGTTLFSGIIHSV